MTPGVGPMSSNLAQRLSPIHLVGFAAVLLVLAGLLAWMTHGPVVASAVAAVGTVGGLAGLLVLFRRDRRSGSDRTVGAAPGGGALSGGARASLLAWILAGDALLGGLVHLAGAVPAVVAGPASGLVAVLVAPAFVLTAGIEILLLAAGAYPERDPSLRLLLAAQGALLILTPTAFGPTWWAAASAYVGTALIVAVFVVALQFLYRHKQLSGPLLSVLVRWPFAAVVTGAGWFLWTFDGLWIPLAAAVVAQLAAGLYTALSPALPSSGERVPWLLRPFSIFEFLLFTFLAEFFLGTLLDYRIVGPTFLQFIPFVPVRGTSIYAAGLLVYNGLWFAAAILASAWFLILLGFTMGPLVVLKIRETHERAQKYRLSLTIAAYALAAIWLPSFASSTPLTNAPWLANIPIIGWGFGLRDGGPFESGIFLAIIAMYVLVGTLTVLFGRKAICAVMCGAALMYQGTMTSELRGFNQTSRIGKHFLGSQLSTTYVVMSGVALVSLFAVSLLSVLRWIPPVQVANGELDTAALPLPIELYFGGLWFAMFVTTPFIGSYNCATTGFCHWGALSLPFARVGFFRLKVKDKKICQACTTFECAKACPVGLVDMPLYFRRDGEYRSAKCCGIGDCVGACPYGNMYHQDVRFWIRRKLGGKAPAPAAPLDRGTPLPMVPSAAPVRSSPAPARAAPAGAVGTAPTHPAPSGRTV